MGVAPQFIDSDYVKPGAFANREEIKFLPPVGVKEVYYTGVPDPVTISKSLPGLTEVTASGGLHQAEGNDFMETMVRWGFTSYENVPGLETNPMEFLMTFLSSEEGKPYFDIESLDEPMAVRVRVEGEKDGKVVSAGVRGAGLFEERNYLGGGVVHVDGGVGGD